MTTISFYTLGCRLNQSETAVVQRTFETSDYKVVDISEPADVVVINTCTVTENGDADTRRLVNKVNRINPKSKIALIGCQAQIQKEKLTEMTNVKWVVGNAKKMNIKSIIEEFADSAQPQVITPTIPRESFTIPLAGIDRDHTRANIKIQDGCDFFCSFCEIPYARGRARSREFDDILLEVKALVAAKHKEIVITGINVGTYANANKTLLDVISALEQIDGLERIRISSIEPTTIPTELFKKMAQKTKLCRYLHIPVQSANDHMLSAMKRKYNFQEFSRFIQTAYDIVPEICIGTDVIVGFPGETEEHFQESMDRLRDAPIHYFHVFSYSKRHLAKSQNLTDEIPIQVKQHRSKLLRDLSQRKRLMHFKSLLGSTQRVLFEQKKEGLWSGLTDNYVRVAVASHENLENQLRSVRLVKISDACIQGVMIENEENTSAYLYNFNHTSV